MKRFIAILLLVVLVLSLVSCDTKIYNLKDYDEVYIYNCAGFMQLKLLNISAINEYSSYNYRIDNFKTCTLKVTESTFILTAISATDSVKSKTYTFDRNGYYYELIKY